MSYLITIAVTWICAVYRKEIAAWLVKTYKWAKEQRGR